MITEAWIEKLSRVLHNSTDGLCDEDVRNLHDLRQSILPIPGVVEKEVAGPVAQELRAGLAGFLREQEVANGVKPDEKPFPGYLDKEVPGEVKKEALAARDAAMQAQGIPPCPEAVEKAARLMLKPPEDLVAKHVSSVEQRNLQRFLQFIALNDPRGFDAIAPHLHRVSSPRRYQAWGQIVNAECPLWTKGNAGGDLELMNRSDSCGDRIELIDRIGIVPDPGVLSDTGLMLLFEEPESIRLVTHNLETAGHRTFPFKYITQFGGVKLTGAGRQLVMPRSIVPRLQLRCPFEGQVFVEGWRISLG